MDTQGVCVRAQGGGGGRRETPSGLLEATWPSLVQAFPSVRCAHPPLGTTRWTRPGSPTDHTQGNVAGGRILLLGAQVFYKLPTRAGVLILFTIQRGTRERTRPPTGHSGPWVLRLVCWATGNPRRLPGP